MATDKYVSGQEQKWEAYLKHHQVEKIFRDLTSDLITLQPEDSVQHMISFLHEFRRARDEPKEAKKGKKGRGSEASQQSSSDSSGSSSEDDVPFVAIKPTRTRRDTIAAPRLSILKNWAPPSITKTPDQERFLALNLMSIFFIKSMTRKEIGVLVGAMRSVTYESGAEIIKQGDRGDAFYIVEAGTVDCLKNNEKVLTIPCTSKEDPSVERRYFGELALLYDAPRAASVKAVGNVTTWALDRTTFKSILQQSEDVKQILYSKFVQSIHLFRDLKLMQVNALCNSLTGKDYEDGDVVVTQGDKGDAFYIVESGEARCFKDGLEVSVVREGDYFGELALQSDAPRQATVKVVGSLSVVKIGRSAFKRIIGNLEFDKVY